MDNGWKIYQICYCSGAIICYAVCLVGFLCGNNNNNRIILQEHLQNNSILVSNPIRTKSTITDYNINLTCSFPSGDIQFLVLNKSLRSFRVLRMPRVNFEQFCNLLRGILIQIQQNTERGSALGYLTSSKDHQCETSDGEKQHVNKICQPKNMVNSKNSSLFLGKRNCISHYQDI